MQLKTRMRVEISDVGICHLAKNKKTNAQLMLLMYDLNKLRDEPETLSRRNQDRRGRRDSIEDSDKTQRN